MLADAFGLTWPHPLPPWQQEGIARLAQGSLLLADDMGLGKTVQAIAALRVLGAEARPALVVAPASLLHQWQAQLRLWAPELNPALVQGTPREREAAWWRRADIHLASYESLRADMDLPGPLGPAHRAWGVVVADEAQRLKNGSTATAMAVRRLRTHRAWALTGTPLENRIDDLVAILDFVVPGAFERRTLALGLRPLLDRVQLRRRRAEVLPNLPPKTGFTIDPGMGPAQRAAYAAAERQGQVFLRAQGASVRVTQVLELLLRLKQICNAVPETGESAKLDDLERRIEAAAAGGEKSLVFSQFTEAPFGVSAIAQRLRRFAPLTLTGADDTASRAATLRRFSEDAAHKVLVLSLRAGGVGLNLTAASVVFHFDRWWTAAVEAQAEDRAHRMGQQLPVQVFTYVTPRTVESRIAEIIARKRALADLFVDGIGPEGLEGLALADLLQAAGAT
jgi:SNF2 family DNA or RNA helicase